MFNNPHVVDLIATGLVLQYLIGPSLMVESTLAIRYDDRVFSDLENLEK